VKVRALRGVCLGPGRDIVPPQVAEVDPATAKFLIGIGAVEEVTAPAEPPKTEAPVKAGKKES
jgi:hypothetical protein